MSAVRADMLPVGHRTPWGPVRSTRTYVGHNGAVFTDVTTEPYGGTYTVCAETLYSSGGREVDWRFAAQYS